MTRETVELVASPFYSVEVAPRTLLSAEGQVRANARALGFAIAPAQI